jgi:hypothetical protein
VSVRDLIAPDLFEGKLFVGASLVLTGMDMKRARCDVVYGYHSF